MTIEGWLKEVLLVAPRVLAHPREHAEQFVFWGRNIGFPLLLGRAAIGGVPSSLKTPKGD